MPYEDEDPPYVEPDEELNSLSHSVIGAALEVHRALGPGLDESSYANALRIEFDARSIEYVSEVWIDIIYRDQLVGRRRMDFIVGGRLVVEIKAVEEILPLHKAQLHTYLKLTGQKLGLLINFNVGILKDGIRRVIRG